MNINRILAIIAVILLLIVSSLIGFIMMRSLKPDQKALPKEEVQQEQSVQNSGQERSPNESEARIVSMQECSGKKIKISNANIRFQNTYAESVRIYDLSKTDIGEQKSPKIDPGGSQQYQFDSNGEYSFIFNPGEYKCILDVQNAILAEQTPPTPSPPPQATEAAQPAPLTPAP